MYRGADLLVLPGTGGLAVQQAMSFGLPVIGNRMALNRPGVDENGGLTAPTDEALSKLVRTR
jgi:glycosyltransferase involved in cell wall biosynthesis